MVELGCFFKNMISAIHVFYMFWVFAVRFVTSTSTSNSTITTGLPCLSKLVGDGKSQSCGEQACPALGCAAAPKQTTWVYASSSFFPYWGCFAAQRRASLLATVVGCFSGVGSVFTMLMGLPGWLFWRYLFS
ncbi:hypothetical protein QF043_003420 [Pseudomonas sp. W3I7]|uniref:hypothetical protein n=1 Tax=Pseudomonas sp. W3I7 TaxID=3042292 RepID=UPI002792C7F9|nr:hypothetical protein [Pseudomonas sp. W3I7]MDQ0704628.1 hypothetical protein [Pseudomonas sp. W3I7]